MLWAMTTTRHEKYSWSTNSTLSDLQTADELRASFTVSGIKQTIKRFGWEIRAGKNNVNTLGVFRACSDKPR